MRQAQYFVDCLQVAAYVPESALYTQLQKYERKTDACLLQKQSEVQDALCVLHVPCTYQEASATSSGSQTDIFAE